MGKKRHTAEEIVAKLRQVEVLTAQGRTVAEAIRQIGVTEVTDYRWRNEYGGLKSDQVKRLKEPLHTRLPRSGSKVPSSSANETTAIPCKPASCAARAISNPHTRPSEFPCKGGFHHPSLKRPSKRMANWAFAMPHSRGGIFHSFCVCLKTRNNSLNALSSVGKWPRARTARRSLALSASMALVV